MFIAIQEWYQIDTYNLYQSDPQGASYSIALENVRSTKQPEENVLIDILEVNVSFLKNYNFTNYSNISLASLTFGLKIFVLVFLFS